MPASLHNHSFYSILDAICSPKQLVQQAKDFGYNAISLSEHGVMYSIIEGFKASQELNLKYIPSCEIYETDDMFFNDKKANRFHLLLLAKSDEGYINLNNLVSEGHLDGFYFKMRNDLDNLQKYSKDIVCLSGCMAGRISRLLLNDYFDCAVEWVNEYKKVFNDYYLEIQCHKNQEELNKKIIKLAEKTNTPFVVTFDSHMLNEKQLPIHQKFIQIAQDREVGESYIDCWQIDPDKVLKIMSNQIGIDYAKEAILNTDRIAEMCNVEIKLHQDLMPHIKIPKEFKTDTDYLKHLVNEGWKERGLHKLPTSIRKQYIERVKHEIQILDFLGYSSYFIMLKQYLDEAKKRNIPIGYSRGSGGNCMILYCITVTSVNSVKWDLDFTRFGNKGRVGSMADYDIDVARDRRSEMVEIAAELFGEDNIAHMATFNSMSPKVCIKDLGKVFDEEKTYDIPYKERENIAKLVPDGVTIEEALNQSKNLQDYHKKYPLLFEYTKVLQNIPKSVGCHAAAIAVTDKPLTNYCALQKNKDGKRMIQLSMYSSMDDLGIIKIDVLGIKTLDVVDNTLKLANLTWNDIDIDKLDLNDPKVYEATYKNGNTLGIFQMESPEAVQMCIDCQCDNIEDVIAVNAANRPGTKALFPDYVYNKFHEDKKGLIHEDLKELTKDAHHVLLYQEHFLKIFEYAGFPEEVREQARKAIGKKIPEKMAKLEIDLKEGLLKKNWTQKQVDEMWDLLFRQSTYSFNKGHSTGYGLLSYVTAWLKTYYPIEFMTALMTSEKGNFQQVGKYICECERLGIKVLPPLINESDNEFSIYNNHILFGLSMIKGVGDNSYEIIKNNRPYNSLKDFLEKTKLDITTNLSLIKSGAFDDFNKNREELLLEFAKLSFTPLNYKEVATVNKKQKEQLLELKMINEDDFKNKELCLKELNKLKYKEWEDKNNEKYKKHIINFKEKYMEGKTADWEMDVLNMYLTEDPYKKVKDMMKSYEDISEGSTELLCGTILDVKNKVDKNKNKYCYIDLINHEQKIIECVCWASTYSKKYEIIKKKNKIVLQGKKKENRIFIKDMKLFDKWEYIHLNE